MRLALPPYALVFPLPAPSTAPSREKFVDAVVIDDRPREVVVETFGSTEAQTRLRVELVIFSVLLFLNFVKYFVLGVGLGCG